MKDIIDIEMCAECGARPVKPPRRKYCSEECAKVAERKQWAASKRKKRGDTNVPSSIQSSFQSSSKVVDTLSIVPAKPELQNLQAIMQTVSLALHQRLYDFKTEILSLIEEKNQMLDEVLFVMVQDPEVRQEILQREKLIHEAKALLNTFYPKFKEYKIRQYLQRKTGISKYRAEEIMREAME